MKDNKKDNKRDPAIEAFVAHRSDLIALATAVVGCRAVAEELVQESWICWDKKKYPQSKAVPIFKRIVLNLSRDWYRRRQTEKAILNTEFFGFDAALDAERVVIAKQVLKQTIEALSQLPERTLEAFRMHRLEGLTYAQIGERLDVVPSRAHQLVCNALVHLAIHVDE